MMSHLINSMSIERTMVLSKNIHQYAHENGGWQAEINLINQSRLNRAIDVDVMVDDLNAWLPSALSEYQKKIDMLEIISTQPSSAYEYVDFIVTEDDRFIIIGSGVQIKNPGEDSFADYPHESPDQPLHIIYADSAVNMTEYMGAVWQ